MSQPLITPTLAKFLKQLEIGEKFRVRTSSISMFPLINPNTELIVTVIDQKELKPGDIIVFFSQKVNELIAHRIKTIDLKKGTFHTKGDYNAEIDAWKINYSQILGRAESCVENSQSISLTSPASKIFGLNFFPHAIANNFEILINLEKRLKLLLKKTLLLFYLL